MGDLSKLRKWVEANPTRYSDYRKEYEKSDKVKAYRKSYREKYWKAALKAYGSVCDHCGDDRHEVLTIDHINKDGAKHRKSLNCHGGIGFYLWLSKNNYPKGFRVLCFNCNCCLGLRGFLPSLNNSLREVA